MELFICSLLFLVHKIGFFSFRSHKTTWKTYEKVHFSTSSTLKNLALLGVYIIFCCHHTFILSKIIVKMTLLRNWEKSHPACTLQRLKRKPVNRTSMTYVLSCSSLNATMRKWKRKRQMSNCHLVENGKKKLCSVSFLLPRVAQAYFTALLIDRRLTFESFDFRKPI